MGNLWMRLMPGIIFCYVSLVLVGVKDWWNFPFCFFPAGAGIGFSQSLIGYSDWFVGVYFIVSCFFIYLFFVSRRNAWFWICTVMILCWCIQINNKPGGGLGLGGMHYGALAHGAVRGLTCMALGMMASYLSNLWNPEKRLALRIVATVYETVVLYMLFNFMYRSSCVRYSPIAIELAAAMLLISGTHGWGFLSDLLNRISGVMWVSRYTYSIFLIQGTLCSYFSFNHNFNLPHPTCSLIIFGAAIPLTLVEYHIVEKWLVPKLKLCF